MVLVWRSTSVNVSSFAFHTTHFSLVGLCKAKLRFLRSDISSALYWNSSPAVKWWSTSLLTINFLLSVASCKMNEVHSTAQRRLKIASDNSIIICDSNSFNFSIYWKDFIFTNYLQCDNYKCWMYRMYMWSLKNLAAVVEIKIWKKCWNPLTARHFNKLMKKFTLFLLLLNSTKWKLNMMQVVSEELTRRQLLEWKM